MLWQITVFVDTLIRPCKPSLPSPLRSTPPIPSVKHLFPVPTDMESREQEAEKMATARRPPMRPCGTDHIVDSLSDARTTATA